MVRSITEQQIEGIVAYIVQDWLTTRAEADPGLLICLCAPEPSRTHFIRPTILRSWYVDRSGVIHPLTAEGVDHFIAQRQWGVLDFVQARFSQSTDSDAIVCEHEFSLEQDMATIPHAVTRHAEGWLLVVDEAGSVVKKTITYRRS
jgi:hypothetical protein